MKNNQLIAMLVGILLITTGFCAFNAYRYNSAFRQRQQLAPNVAAARYGEGIISAIAGDAVDYSKRNPAINPILKEFNVTQGANQPGAGARPATR